MKLEIYSRHDFRTGDANPAYRYIDYKRTILAEGQDEEDSVFPPSIIPPTL